MGRSRRRPTANFRSEQSNRSLLHKDHIGYPRDWGGGVSAGVGEGGIVAAVGIKLKLPPVGSTSITAPDTHPILPCEVRIKYQTASASPVRAKINPSSVGYSWAITTYFVSGPARMLTGEYKSWVIAENCGETKVLIWVGVSVGTNVVVGLLTWLGDADGALVMLNPPGVVAENRLAIGGANWAIPALNRTSIPINRPTNIMGYTT